MKISTLLPWSLYLKSSGTHDNLGFYRTVVEILSLLECYFPSHLLT
jgi:hypothetical protein